MIKSCDGCCDGYYIGMASNPESDGSDTFLFSKVEALANKKLHPLQGYN